jgi:sarcosine oxidase subunit beta
MSGRQADVVIVGGGIMGSAAGFFLRRRGLSVILLERDVIARHASGTNFGNVRRQGRFLPQLPLANRSRDIWGRLPELVGEDAEFVVSGHIRVAYRDEDAAGLEAYARDCRSYGLELELLSGNALRDRHPYLGREVVLASSSPLDGHANPRLAAPALARAARRLGADVREGVEVTAVLKAGDDFEVQTRAEGSFRAPVALICAGAWANALAAGNGESAPLVPRGPQMGVTEPMPYELGPVVGVASARPEEGIYLRQVKRGNIVFGGCYRAPVDTERRLARVDPAITTHQLGELRRVVPALRHVSVIRTWSGIEGYIADDIPVMGPSGTVAGLYYAYGFCGHGFQLGPGVGDVMAELIATGATTTPIAPFSITRFKPRRPVADGAGQDQHPPTKEREPT